MDPRISVVIPAYNEEKLISKTLDSLVNQNIDENFEVIVVDNNSTDKTVEIVKNFSNKLTNLKIVKQSKQGIAPSRNKGFETARGEIVASTDSDEILPENWLRVITKTLRSDDRVVACFGPYLYYDKSWLFNRLTLIVFYVSDFMQMILGGVYGLRGGNCAFKKDAWKIVGGFNEELNILEDVEIALRLKKIGKIVYLPNLPTKTTYRRFEGRVFSQIVHKLFAYWHIVFAKTNKTADPGNFR